MEYKNKLKLTWISFLSYGLTGALFIITGILLSNIAVYFHLPVSSMSNTFTFLNSGILVSIFLNSWLMEIIPLKRQLVFGFILMILAILGLIIGKNLSIFSFSISVLGIVSGITMSIGTYLITYMYHGSQRSIYLLFSDSFFSMAGTIFPIIAGVILSHHIFWYWVYACIGIIYIFIFILTLISDFPELNKNKIHTNSILLVKKKWNIRVMLLAASALCYILGQLSFISWIPEYASKHFKMDIQQSSRLVSNFWITYMIGMWVFSVIFRFVNSQNMITVLSAISAMFVYLFVSTEHSKYLSCYLLCLGFFSSAIYTTIISLSSQQMSVSSPKLVNFILTCGTIGTMLTFIITGPIVSYYGVSAALNISNMLYIIVFIFLSILSFFDIKK